MSSHTWCCGKRWNDSIIETLIGSICELEVARFSSLDAIFQKIWWIRVHSDHHVTCCIYYSGIQMFGHVIKEILHDSSTRLMQLLGSGWLLASSRAKWSLCIRLRGDLTCWWTLMCLPLVHVHIISVMDRCMILGRIMWLGWYRVLILMQCFLDVTWHWQVDV